VPHYRLDRMQVDLGVRLPASTQGELMAQAGQALEPVHEALITLAAQGKVIHNDDTTMRGQSLTRPLRGQSAPGSSPPASSPRSRTTR
jgi:Transposase IS66 family